LVNFTCMWLYIVTNFVIIKPTRCTNFTNLFRHETLHVSGSSSARHQEFIHCTLGTGICHTGLKTAFEQDQDGTGFILLLTRNCLKHVEFHAGINLWNWCIWLVVLQRNISVGWPPSGPLYKTQNKLYLVSIIFM
jgi:hypothetical protein